MRNPFKRKKDNDVFDVLREALSTETEVPKDNPTITLTKTETVQIEEKLEPQVPQVKPVSEETISEEQLNLIRKLLDIFRGKIEIGNRLRPLLNPENLQTTTRLSQSEIDFVTDAHWLASQWKIFEPLRDLANEICETKISEEGKGRQEAINFVSALTEGKLLKSLTVSAEAPSKGRFGFIHKGKEKTEAET